MSIEAVKKAIGVKAASLIEEGMTVGLGTGSTAFYFIESLIERCHAGLKIQTVASSQKSSQQARAGGLPLLDINLISSLDITVDGADEVDSLKQMIKGGGGALVREKIVASMSREMVVLIDETKLVAQLGSKNLPVEIIPFGHLATQRHLEEHDYRGEWRIEKNGALFITDNNNYILDIHFQNPLTNPQADHERMIEVPGVVDTGFFFHLAGRMIIGFLDGQIIIRS